MPNKVTVDLREMVLGALQDAGGRAYLVQQSKENPTAFLTLVGKCMPKNVKVFGSLNLEKMSDEDLDDKLSEILAGEPGGT